MAHILNKYQQQQNISGSRLRVWSLVVTIFGDAIKPRGGVLRLGALHEITGHIGIESNALRTAVSRLASDGWLERERIGRASYYRPSKVASGEIFGASTIIYQFFPTKWNQKWIFAVPLGDEGFGIEAKLALHRAGFAFHSRKLAVAPDMGAFKLTADLNQVAIFSASSFDEHNIGQFLKKVIFHHNCEALYGEFANSAAALLESVKDTSAIDDLDALLLRTLLVHQWRRIVLKDVHWPRELRSKHWPGFAAQALIKELYHRLLEPSENWLSKLDGTPTGRLPEADNVLAQRFLS